MTDHLGKWHKPYEGSHCALTTWFIYYCRYMFAMSCLLSACHICSCSITSKTRLLCGVFCESFCSIFVFFPCLFFNIRCVYAAFFFFCICCSAFPLSTLPEHFEPSCSVMQNHLLLKAHVIFPLLLECYWKEVACSSTALSHHCPLLQGFHNNIDEDCGCQWKSEAFVGLSHSAIWSSMTVYPSHIRIYSLELSL